MSPIRAAVPTAEEVSALLAGVWRTVDTETDAVAAELAGDESDAVLLDLVATPFASVSDVNERLARTESYLRERGDRRAVFLTVYSRMTATVQTAIDDGAFLDSEWAASYLVAFAERYRRALVAFERRAFESLPRPWLIAFAAAARSEALVAQDALLGINAHITYDLTYTLGDVGIDPDRDGKLADHDRINAILAHLVQTVQDALVETYAAVEIAGVDRLLDPLDDRLALLGLKGSRSSPGGTPCCAPIYRRGSANRTSTGGPRPSRRAPRRSHSRPISTPTHANACETRRPTSTPWRRSTRRSDGGCRERGERAAPSASRSRGVYHPATPPIRHERGRRADGCDRDRSGDLDREVPTPVARRHPRAGGDRRTAPELHRAGRHPHLLFGGLPVQARRPLPPPSLDRCTATTTGAGTSWSSTPPTSAGSTWCAIGSRGSRARRSAATFGSCSLMRPTRSRMRRRQHFAGRWSSSPTTRASSSRVTTRRRSSTRSSRVAPSSASRRSRTRPSPRRPARSPRRRGSR